MNKKGLSQLVTTIILVMLILVAVGGIYAVVNNFITKSTGKIGTDQFTISLTLRSATVDYTSGVAEVRVRRNQGEGDLTGIKFIVEDTKSSDIFEEKFESFPELAERTFELDLYLSEYLVLNDIYKISIAPMFIGPSGAEGLGNIAGSIEGLNDGLGDDAGRGDEEDEEEEGEEEGECDTDADCPDDVLDPDSARCTADDTGVIRDLLTYSCLNSWICLEVPSEVIEDCEPGWTCSGAVLPARCVEELQFCEVDLDCVGDRGIISNSRGCDFKDELVVDINQSILCEGGSCNDYQEEVLVENCTAQDGMFCFAGLCFAELECEDHPDCCPPETPNCGIICNESNVCVDEEVVNSGEIFSAWPSLIGEYFDSSDLPLDQTEIKLDDYVIFPNSLETRCFYVRDFVVVPEGYPYVKLNSYPNNITTGDTYEIWETEFGCSGAELAS